jgi:hypothetical protein
MEVRMDALMSQLARELTEAISVAVAADPKVDACREKARAAGYELRLSLEAVVGWNALDRKARRTAPVTRRPTSGGPVEMSANDRRFLKSLRISADEPTEEKEVE